jgi:ABC-type lipoprotein release transport system permease subunit
MAEDKQSWNRVDLADFVITIGLVAAAVLTQLMRTLLFGIRLLDPVTFVTVPLVLVAAAVLASYLPTARAASVNPVDALKAE